MSGKGFRAFRVQDVEFRMQASGFRVQDLGFTEAPRPSSVLAQDVEWSSMGGRPNLYYIALNPGPYTLNPKLK